MCLQSIKSSNLSTISTFFEERSNALRLSQCALSDRLGKLNHCTTVKANQSHASSDANREFLNFISNLLSNLTTKEEKILLFNPKITVDSHL